jgi:hypothetical protein
VVEADGPKAVTIDHHGGHMWATVARQWSWIE